MTALAIRGLAARRGDREILRAVELEVEPGEIVAVLGPSGAGKSTLFSVVTGDLDATAGTVTLDDRPLVGPSWRRARRGLAYLPQGPSVLWDLTAEQNVRTFADLAGVTVDPRAHLARFALEHRADVAAKSLSGGERRRLELARALLGTPRVLLCDEPFSGLHPRAIAELAPAIAAAKAAGTAVLLADHHAPEALALASRALLLVDGAAVITLPAADFLGHPLVTARYLAPRPDIPP